MDNTKPTPTTIDIETLLNAPQVVRDASALVRAVHLSGANIDIMVPLFARAFMHAAMAFLAKTDDADLDMNCGGIRAVCEALADTVTDKATLAPLREDVKKALADLKAEQAAQAKESPADEPLHNPNNLLVMPLAKGKH